MCAPRRDFGIALNISAKAISACATSSLVLVKSPRIKLRPPVEVGKQIVHGRD